jgi:hypothetical protein
MTPNLDKVIWKSGELEKTYIHKDVRCTYVWVFNVPVSKQ